MKGRIPWRAFKEGLSLPKTSATTTYEERQGGTGKTTIACAFAVAAEQVEVDTVLSELAPKGPPGVLSDLREADTPVTLGRKRRASRPHGKPGLCSPSSIRHRMPQMPPSPPPGAPTCSSSCANLRHPTSTRSAPLAKSPGTQIGRLSAWSARRQCETLWSRRPTKPLPVTGRSARPSLSTIASRTCMPERRGAPPRRSHHGEGPL